MYERLPRAAVSSSIPTHLHHTYVFGNKRTHQTLDRLTTYIHGCLLDSNHEATAGMYTKNVPWRMHTLKPYKRASAALSEPRGYGRHRELRNNVTMTSARERGTDTPRHLVVLTFSRLSLSTQTHRAAESVVTLNVSESVCSQELEPGDPHVDDTAPGDVYTYTVGPSPTTQESLPENKPIR